MGSDEERLDALLKSINLSENDTNQKQQKSQSASALDRLKMLQAGEDEKEASEKDVSVKDAPDKDEADDSSVNQENTFEKERRIHSEDILSMTEEEINRLLGDNEKENAGNKAEPREEYEDNAGDENLSDIEELLGKLDKHEIIEEKDYFGQEGSSRDTEVEEAEDSLYFQDENAAAPEKNKTKAKKSGGFFSKFGFGKKKKPDVSDSKEKLDTKKLQEEEANPNIAAQTTEKEFDDLVSQTAKKELDDLESQTTKKELDDLGSQTDKLEQPENALQSDEVEQDVVSTDQKEDLTSETNPAEEADGSQVDNDILNSVFDKSADEISSEKSAADAFEIPAEITENSLLDQAPNKEKKSFLKRILDALFEETDTDEADAEVGIEEKNAAENSEEAENSDKKAASKGGKKPKKEKNSKKDNKAGEEDQDEKGKSGKKEKPEPKKPKKEKVKKEKVKPEDTEPPVKIAKKKIILVAMLAFSIIAAIMIIDTIGIQYLELKDAREAYITGDYQTTYEMYSGKKLGKADEAQYQRAVAVLKMQNKLSAYSNHERLGKKAAALNDLIEGVSLYQKDYKNTAFDLITAELKNVYQKVLNLLLTNYNLTESAAKTIADDNDDYTYSLRIDAVVNGTKYTDPNAQKSGTTNQSKQSASAGQNAQSGQNSSAGNQQSTGQVPDALPPEQESMNNGSNS